jgi:hypothetical protein
MLSICKECPQKGHNRVVKYKDMSRAEFIKIQGHEPGRVEKNTGT